jgi:glycyl-tRNA synthetase beta chain
LAFFALRLQHLLEGEGIGRETVEAVIAAGWDEFCEIKLRAQALQVFQNHPDFPSLAVGCKRALNILKGVSLAEVGKVNPELLTEREEKELFQKVQESQAELEHLFKQKGYSDYLLHLAQLRPTIDAFFDKVLVMAPEEKIRNNRLALLVKLTSLFNRFALFLKFDALL